MTLLHKLSLVLFVSAVISMSMGCERKETLVDIETPGGGVEVERDKDSGEVEVDVNDKD